MARADRTGHTSANSKSRAGDSAPMSKTRGEEFAALLVKKRVLGPDQVEEARGMAAQTGVKLQDALVKLNYCTAAEVMRAIAEHHSMPFVELKGTTIPTAVVEMVPES